MYNICWECFVCSGSVPKDDGDFILVDINQGDYCDEVWSCNKCIDKNESEDE